jgi:hypothetical protein
VVATLPSGARGQRATAALLKARLRRAEGDTASASALLEDELRALSTDGKKPLTLFSLPFVAAGEWRLMAGDARGADSLALLARRAGMLDSLSATHSALVGRAELLRARTLLALGDPRAAGEAAARAP